MVQTVKLNNGVEMPMEGFRQLPAGGKTHRPTV